MVHTVGDAPPSAGQRAFFKRLEADYSSLRERCKTELEEELREWKDDYNLCCSENSLTLRGLDVPFEFDDKTTWEVSFEVDPAIDDHVFKVVMRGWRAETAVAVAS